MFCRFIAAAAILFATALPAAATLAVSPLGKLSDEALSTAASRMKAKDYQGAREAALKSGDKGVRAFLVGISALRLESFEEAASQLAVAADNYPLLADYALYHQGVALSKLRRFDQALTPLYRLLKQYPECRLARPALLLYSDTLFAGGYFKEALQGYTSFIERYPLGSDSLAALFGSALSRDKLGDPAAAAVILRGIWLNSPASPLAAKCALELQRLAALGVKIERYGSAELFKRSCILYDLNRSSEAARALAELPLAGESEEFAAKVRFKTGQALFKARRYQEAQVVFDGIVQRNPEGSGANEASLWSAKCLAKSGKQDEAYQTYLKLAELSKGGSVADDALMEAAYLKRFRRKWSEALQIFRVFLAKHPERKNAAVTWEAAWASYQSRDYQGAASYLKKISDREEFREKALYWLGKALLAQGDGKGAEAQFATLAAEYPTGYYALICDRWCDIGQFPPVPKSVIDQLPLPAGFEREKALITLGMLDEAARELSRSKKGKSAAGIARLYLEMGNYNGALHAMDAEKPKPSDKGSAIVWGVAYPLAYGEEVAKYAALNGVPEGLVYAVMRTESNYFPAALSPVGAVGLMQIMPATAETISKGASARLATPELNIRLGTKHLKGLLAMYEGNIALTAAAYNAGTGNVKKWQQGFGGLPRDEFVETIPFRETREYVKKVITAMELYRRLYRLPAYKN